MSEKFYEYVNKLDNKVKSVLTKKQYDTHVKNFGAIKKSIEKKILKIE
jgi:hypothetical protein